jgi:hypothetical protein
MQQAGHDQGIAGRDRQRPGVFYRMKLTKKLLNFLMCNMTALQSQTLGAGPSRILLTPPAQPQTLSQILGMFFLLLIDFCLLDHKEGLEDVQLSNHASTGMFLYIDSFVFH